MAYFAMLSGQGWTAIAGCRQFFYARYADWLVTTTLIVILLGLVANAGNDVIFGACGANGKSLFCPHPSLCSAAFPPQGVSIDFTSLASRRPAALRGCSNELALEHKCPEHFMLRASNFWTCRHLHCCGLHGVRLGSHHRQVVLVPHRPRGAVWRTCALRADLQGLR